MKTRAAVLAILIIVIFAVWPLGASAQSTAQQVGLPKAELEKVIGQAREALPQFFAAKKLPDATPTFYLCIQPKGTTFSGLRRDPERVFPPSFPRFWIEFIGEDGAYLRGLNTDPIFQVKTDSLFEMEATWISTVQAEIVDWRYSDRKGQMFGDYIAKAERQAGVKASANVSVAAIYDAKTPAEAKATAARFMLGTWSYTGDQWLTGGGQVWLKWDVRSDGSVLVSTAARSDGKWGAPRTEKWEIVESNDPETGKTFLCFQIKGDVDDVLQEPLLTYIQPNGEVTYQREAGLRMARGDRARFAK